MTESDTELQGELPVGIAEVFLWTSWRTWAIFFGTAFATGVLGAGLGNVLAMLDSRFTGIFDILIWVLPAAVAGSVIIFHVTNRMVLLLWSTEILTDRFAGKANLTVGFIDRDDYLLELLWLSCSLVVMVFAGRFIADLVGLDIYDFEPALVITIWMVFEAWRRVLSRILERAAKELR